MVFWKYTPALRAQRPDSRTPAGGSDAGGRFRRRPAFRRRDAAVPRQHLLRSTPHNAARSPRRRSAREPRFGRPSAAIRCDGAAASVRRLDRARPPSTRPDHRGRKGNLFRSCVQLPPVSPPTRDATTGTSHAIASSAAKPKLSCDDGSRHRGRISTGAARPAPARPERLDIGRQPQLLPRAAARGREGPDRHPPAGGVPASARRMRRKMSTTTSTRLTGRKLETWITSLTYGDRRRR